MDGDTPLPVAVDAYLADCRRRRLRPATLRYYEQALATFVEDGPNVVAEISLDAGRAYLDRSERLSGRSLRGYVRALRTFVGWLVSEDALASDPLGRLRLPRVDDAYREVPDDAGLIAVMAAQPVAARLVTATLAATGMRIGELCRLELADCLQSKLIVRTGKSRRGRPVPLDPLGGEIIALVRASRRRGGTSALFVSRSGSELSPSAVRQALAMARVTSGLPIPISPHILRHWHARDLAQHGTDPRLLAARMGWRLPDLVERYAPVSEAELVADAARYSPVTRLADAGLLEGLLPLGRARPR